jgi:hypothetical protein
MVKLLWKALHGVTSEEEFHHRFSYNDPIEIKDCQDVLKPIQDRLKWVMEGFFRRQQEDSELGQGDWGEYWWLPKEQAAFVRAQLQQSSADLIEGRSDYDDYLCRALCSMILNVVQGVAVPCLEAGRLYVGTRDLEDRHVFVTVQSESGQQFPLKHVEHAYLEADGTGFEWGYGGTGPYLLAQSILIDALDGDVQTANKLQREFLVQFLVDYPRDQELRLSRSVILRWVEKQGEKETWEARRVYVADQIARHASVVARDEARLKEVKRMGGLRTQRFDIVPPTFEAALYLDLMRMLENSDFAMRCSGCKLPIPYDKSARANKQRARAKKGQPIYHPECFAEYSKLRKKIYWRRRSHVPGFREQERQRSSAYRKIT